MPQEPKPSPPFDRSFSRNLFVGADPDLDALIESTADEPARAAGVRRRGRGLVVLAEQHRSPHAGRAHDVEPFARPNSGIARLLAVARHALRQADAAAGRLLRGLAGGPYRAPAAIVALVGLLIAFGWLVLDVRDTSRARVATDGRLARTAAALRYVAVAGHPGRFGSRNAGPQAFPGTGPTLRDPPPPQDASARTHPASFQRPPHRSECR
jgi:hypothetical protein